MKAHSAPLSFTVRYPTHKRVIITPVGITLAIDPAKGKMPQPKQFNAIWDTGATNTVITKNIVDACGLKPINVVKVHTASGETTANVYFVNLFLPNNVAFVGLRVTEGIIGNGRDVLVGMDVISQGDFAITNTNRETTCSFRTPSQENIDFVTADEAANSAPLVRKGRKIGPNEKCPCDSDKKYKKCCGDPKAPRIKTP